jgi:eukaryotic-like serine/threonine-protein kinase
MVLADRYRLIRQLGRGGMGSVWAAEHLSLRSEVAIKLIDPSIAESPDALARFMREAQASAALRSPHVVQVLDYGVHNGVPFIAMELLQGESLGGRLERCKRLSPEETSRIIGQVARAIGRAHEAGIVHRDLKPDNIFLVLNDDEEVAKVLDFGIAKGRHGSPGEMLGATRTGAMLGTPYYMSPEQTEGSKSVDHRTDLWSIGVIAFECITGLRPFDGETLGGIIMAICGRPIVLPSSVAAVPAGFDEWFLRSTARNPAERFSSAKEQAVALKHVCLGQSAGGLSPTEGYRGSSAQHPNPPGGGMATTGGLGVHTVSSAELDAPTLGTAPVRSRSSLGLVLALLTVFTVGAAAAGYFFLRSRGTEKSPVVAASSVAPQPGVVPALPSAEALVGIAPSPSRLPDVAPVRSSEASPVATGRSPVAVKPTAMALASPHPVASSNPAKKPLPAPGPAAAPPAKKPHSTPSIY